LPKKFIVGSPLGTPKLLAYGSLNVYEINGKAYYFDHTKTKKFVRAPDRDYLIKERHLK
jgi:YHS domain-containing protein